MKITIDGKSITAEAPMTVLDAARKHDIYIPSLCDHSGIEPFSGCRMCLVEIKGWKGLIPSCSTYVEEGMEVKTDTPHIRRIRKNILELILTEHPNACLICTEKENCDEFKSTIRKVGEVTGCVLCTNNHRCELQDVTEKLGLDRVGYPSVYRNVDVDKRDPFFDRNYNLCILCGRCVRVCGEIRGAAAVSFIFRGSKALVGTSLDHSLLEAGCQMCGACVDICPTGALAERSMKYENAPDSQGKTICPFCGVGCSLSIDLFQGKLLRSQPIAGADVNDGQACVRGRFALKESVLHPDRITHPWIRKGKKLVPATWDEALDFAADKIKQYGPGKTGFAASPQASIEDMFVFRNFVRDVLQSDDIAPTVMFSGYDRLRNMAREAGFSFGFNFRLSDIVQSKAILWAAGSASAHPVVWVKVLEALRNGASLITLGITDDFIQKHAVLSLPHSPGSEALLAGYMAKTIMTENPKLKIAYAGWKEFTRGIESISQDDVFQQTGLEVTDAAAKAALFLFDNTSAIIVGSEMLMPPSGEESASALWNLAQLTESEFMFLGQEGNLRGWDEVSRNFSGDTDLQALTDKVKAGSLKALWLTSSISLPQDSSPEFLIVQDVFWNESTEPADVVFPASSFVERSGTYINMEGRIQHAEKVVEPRGQSRPDWWIVSQVARRIKPSMPEYEKASQIAGEVKKNLSGFGQLTPAALKRGEEFFVSEKKNPAFFLPLSFSQEGIRRDNSHPVILHNLLNLDYYRGMDFGADVSGFKRLRDPEWITISSEDADRMDLAEGDEVKVISPAGTFKAFVRLSHSIPAGHSAAKFLWTSKRRNEQHRIFSSETGMPVQAVAVQLKRGK